MKKFYLAVDAFDFHTPQKTFLAVFQNDRINNIFDQRPDFGVDTEILEEYMDRNEIYRYNLYIVEESAELNPFHHTTTISEDEYVNTTPHLNILFNKNTPQDFIDKVIKTVHKQNNIGDSENITYEISNEDFCYKSVEEINREFVLSDMICFVNKNNSVSSPETNEDFDYMRGIIQNAKTVTTDKNKLLRLEKTEERVNNLQKKGKL